MIKNAIMQLLGIMLYTFLYIYVFKFETLVIVMLAQILYYIIGIRVEMSGTTKGDR